MVILIADDEAGIRNSLNLVLKKDNEIIQCEDGVQALQELEKNAVDVVITDFSMPKMTGLELIRLGKEASPSTAFLLMTAFGSVEQAVEAIRLGADDYFMKPFDIEEIEHRIKRIHDLRSWRMEKTIHSETGKAIHSLIGQSAKIARAREFIAKVADVNSPVLLCGPSGCEHEIIAQAIHEASSRVSYPFIVVNCNSSNERLIEADLFGHEKDIIPEAPFAKAGKLELAREGTLVFDEIGGLPLSIQDRLLGVLKEKSFSRLGGTRRIRTDARIIATTQYPSKDLVKEKKLKEGLFLHLNVLNFDIPPLRERREDIPLMVRFYLAKLTKELMRNLALSSEALEALCAYSYPGNLRELQNVIERLVVVGSPTGTIGLDALPSEFKDNAERSSHSPGEHGLAMRLDAYERDLLKRAMEEVNNNQTKAAALLKISRTDLQSRLKRLGLLALLMQDSDEAA